MRNSQDTQPRAIPQACTKRARMIALLAQGVDARTSRRIVYAKPYEPSQEAVREAQQLYAPRTFSLMR
jgi:hypothetical protein